MLTLMQMAAARRAQIATELREIDVFIEQAGELLAGAGLARPEACNQVALPGSNVVPFRRRVRRDGPGATACGTGA